jgi:hypothetical protein
MRKNASRLWMTLALLGPLAGCGGLGSVGVGSPSGHDADEDGVVQISPATITLHVNEKRAVVANLDGPVAYFVRYHWEVSPSSIVVTPRPCSGAANDHRECGADITAVGSGEATVTFTASVRDFIEVKGSLRVSVRP